MASTSKFISLEFPPLLCIIIFRTPAVRPFGTTEASEVAEEDNTKDSTLPKLTLSASWRFVPLIKTGSPAIPLVGSTDDNTAGTGFDDDFLHVIKVMTKTRQAIARG